MSRRDRQGADRLTDERDVADDVSPELAIDAARQPAERNARTGSTDPIGRTRRRRRLGCRPPAAGPPLQPQMHDAASATTPSAATQIRLATANLPALPAAWQSHEASPLWAAREVLVPPGVHSAVCEEWPRLRYLPKPSRRSCRMTAAPSFAEMPHIRWQTSARNRPAACHSN